MKLVELLAILSLALTLNVSHAADTDYAETDYKTYCTEQAEMSGIEEPTEKATYIKECIESFSVPSGDAPQD